MTAPTSPGVVPADVLPSLPRPATYLTDRRDPAFSMNQMRAYAKAAIMADRANRPSLTEDEWEPIDAAPHDTDILIGAWFEDDSNGYFGGSRWKWVASGRIESERVWIDVNDEFHGQLAELAGFDKPTHFKPLRALADRSEPRQEKEDRS